MTPPTWEAGTRSLTHAEFVYAPGDRQLAQDVFSLLGCRVSDRGGAFFTAFIEPTDTNGSANVLYASEVAAAQWAFERELDERSRELMASFATSRRTVPQMTYHCGFRVPTSAALDALANGVRNAGRSGPLAGRVDVAGVFRPGEPGALAPNMVQLFVWTDVVATGILALGQLIEIQHHL